MQILFLLILVFSCSIQASLNRVQLEEIRRELRDEGEKKEETKKKDALEWEAFQKKSNEEREKIRSLQKEQEKKNSNLNTELPVAAKKQDPEEK